MCVDMGGSHFRERGSTKRGVHENGGRGFTWVFTKRGYANPMNPRWLRACSINMFGSYDVAPMTR